jgi:hypothetical protein
LDGRPVNANMSRLELLLLQFSEISLVAHANRHHLAATGGSDLSVYIPWTVEAQLSEPVGGRTYVGPLRDCVWTYLELGEAARKDALIIADADVPLEGRRLSKILERGEIEWLIDRLGNDIYLPNAREGRWL